METTLPQRWIEHLEQLDIAFQPILNIHSGEIFGVEALLRDYDLAGFHSIFDVFDRAFSENVLYAFDIALREKTLKKYQTIQNYRDIKLFFNLDNRLFELPNETHGNTNKILKALDIPKKNLIFEISERHEISNQSNMNRVLNHYKDENYQIAIDDFGMGYSGYKLLYDSTPDILKIDRYFLHDIEQSKKKQLLVRSITHLALQMGIKILAEGVESKKELLTCKEIGCHLLQGYLVQKPTQNVEEILQSYTHIEKILAKERRQKKHSSDLEKHIEVIKPIKIDSKMNHAIDYFKEHKDTLIAPVTNNSDEVIGILKEDKIKKFLYSPYGISLLNNNDMKLKNYIDYCGVADINSDISSIIELYSNSPDASGIIITKELKYYGFLSTKSIINIMNEQSLVLARDQNPLTRLPGNYVINKYLVECSNNTHNYHLCYFDLDNFKAFNDVYGFRNGDRVIQLFADTLRKHLSDDFFKAHIGGDDFFTAIQNIKSKEIQEYYENITSVIKIFSQNVKEFYSHEDKEKNYIESKDRDGNLKQFPLLTVSASIIIVHSKTKDRTLSRINNILSTHKKAAKASPEHICMSTLL